MKIANGPQNTIAPLETARLKKSSGTTAKGAQAAQKSGDAFSVQLSSAVDKMTPPLENDEIRQDKVDAIRKQLAAGTYNISGKDVADKMLNILKG